jgi:hypothetical protein
MLILLPSIVKDLYDLLNIKFKNDNWSNNNGVYNCNAYRDLHCRWTGLLNGLVRISILEKTSISERIFQIPVASCEMVIRD